MKTTYVTWVEAIAAALFAMTGCERGQIGAGVLDSKTAAILYRDAMANPDGKVQVVVEAHQLP